MLGVIGSTAWSRRLHIQRVADKLREKGYYKPVSNIKKQADKYTESLQKKYGTKVTYNKDGEGSRFIPEENRINLDYEEDLKQLNSARWSPLSKDIVPPARITKQQFNNNYFRPMIKYHEANEASYYHRGKVSKLPTLKALGHTNWGVIIREKQLANQTGQYSNKGVNLQSLQRVPTGEDAYIEYLEPKKPLLGNKLVKWKIRKINQEDNKIVKKLNKGKQ